MCHTNIAYCEGSTTKCSTHSNYHGIYEGNQAVKSTSLT
jgi:hypothetical protein